LGNPLFSIFLIPPTFPHGGLFDPTDGLRAQKPGLPGTERRLTQFERFCREDAMNPSEFLETTAWVKGEKKRWSPTVKMILAFILGLLALSPAILGIYWQHLLP
jgi:hypothetical protein